MIGVFSIVCVLPVFVSVSSFNWVGVIVMSRMFVHFFLCVFVFFRVPGMLCLGYISPPFRVVVSSSVFVFVSFLVGICAITV